MIIGFFFISLLNVLFVWKLEKSNYKTIILSDCNPDTQWSMGQDGKAML